jgi:hypothetical protein
MGGAPKTAEDEEAVRLLASIPSIFEEGARQLVDKAFRDFADLVGLALPDTEVRKGLHHAIARRVLLAALAPKGPHTEVSSRCSVCGTALPAGADRCATCGSVASTELPVAAVEQKLKEVTGEMLGLVHDADFRQMPEEVLREFLDAFGGMDREAVMREEYRRQVEAWRANGFDTATLENLLASDLDAFRERGVQLIRTQILKKVQGGEFRCPLCNTSLSPAAEECGNCGAKFA